MKIEVLNIIDQEDGSAELQIEIDEEFRHWIMKCTGMKKWSNKKFQDFIIKAIEKKLE